jgi:DNA polymerase-3 subunit gamma/tau
MASDSYLVFSLKYRPQTFDEIRCQEPVKETLKRAILNNRVAHSYLFCGPRGVGKTTTARILAKALNCTTGPTITPCGVCPSCREITTSRSMDVIEIDGASNRQIDDIRDLRENIKYAPSAGRYKVYIIDEVHMLTEFAFNALLKTLEEPPRHAKFVFATTAPHKVPSTILSRCQRFDFRKASVEELVSLLRDIAGREQINIVEEALFAIARRADGSIRDSETILDQMHAFRPEGVSLPDVEQLLGMVPSEVYSRFVALLKSQNHAALVTFVNEVFDRGYNLIEFFSGQADYLRSLLVLKLGVAREVLGLSPADLKRLDEQAGLFTVRQLSAALETLVGFEENIKFSLVPRILLEVLALKLAGQLEATAGERPGDGTSRPAGTGAPAARASGQREASSERRAAKTDKSDRNDAPGSGAATQRAAGNESGLWSQLLTELHNSKPLLASALGAVEVLESTGDAIRISEPSGHMWDEKELRSELAAAESVLARIAGRAIAIVVVEGSEPHKAKSKNRTLDKLRAVYDCEEV